MDVKQKYTEAANRITLSIDFIDQLDKYKDIKWETIISMVERMDNRLTEPVSLGHVFHDHNNEPTFLEFYFEMRPRREYLLDYMQIVDCDRYLDLMLEDRTVKLTKNKKRWVR